MAESLDDLNLPTAIIHRLIKEALPHDDGKLIVSKDVKLAAGKAASLFILHLTTEALSIANEKNRKTLTGADVIEGVKQCGFESFVDELQLKFQGVGSKKRRSRSRKKDTSKNVSNVEEMEVDEADEEGEEEVEEEEEDDKEEE